MQSVGLLQAVYTNLCNYFGSKLHILAARFMLVSPFGMAWLSTIDDVTLISIFEHFANCYVSMPIVGTCRRIFITWTRKRRQIALGELARLQSWLDEEELRTVRLLNVSHQELRRIEMDGRVVSHASCEICQAIRVVRRFAWSGDSRSLRLALFEIRDLIR